MLWWCDIFFVRKLGQVYRRHRAFFRISRLLGPLRFILLSFFHFLLLFFGGIKLLEKKEDKTNAFCEFRRRIRILPTFRRRRTKRRKRRSGGRTDELSLSLSLQQRERCSRRATSSSQHIILSKKGCPGRLKKMSAPHHLFCKSLLYSSFSVLSKRNAYLFLPHYLFLSLSLLFCDETFFCACVCV